MSKPITTNEIKGIAECLQNDILAECFGHDLECDHLIINKIIIKTLKKVLKLGQNPNQVALDLMTCGKPKHIWRALKYDHKDCPMCALEDDVSRLHKDKMELLEKYAYVG